MASPKIAVPCAAALLLLAATRCAAEPKIAAAARKSTMEARVRRPAVAGQFYPGRTEDLQTEINRCLRGAAGSEDAAPVRALIAPHAGYTYSGPTAGKAYARLKERTDIRRVVVLAPTHRVAMRGISVGNYTAYQTPLGSIPVDTAACERLVEAHDLITTREDAHALEHSLEVQLPFLQTVLADWKLVPVVCGQLDPHQVRAIARHLRDQLWGADTLWVVSSDFTHFGRSFGYAPFQKDVPERIKELDGGAIDAILAREPDTFLDYIEKTGATICGRMPIAILLAALQRDTENWQVELVEYTTSGKMTGDYRHSVSYASLAFTHSAGSQADSDARDMLTEADKVALLKLARKAVETGFERSPAPLSTRDLSAKLKEDGACFVSLHKGGRLCGCIGYLKAVEPLCENIIRNARGAAFHDPRFRPLQEKELPEIDIEISVLTKPVPIDGPDDFVVGKHGIILEKGHARAVFLPQVAPEQGWDRETTLDHLAMKAGLRSNEWRRGAKFKVFEAIVFGEKQNHTE